MARRTIAVAVLLAVGALAPPCGAGAASLVLYAATAGYKILPPDPSPADVFLFVAQSPVPVIRGSPTFFSRSGPGCPDPSTADYRCMRVFGEADLVGGRLVTLRAAAQVRRRNVTGPVGITAYGDARVEFYNMGVAASSPVATAYVNLGLTGAASQGATDAGVSLQAFGTVRVNGVVVQCPGTRCEPFAVPGFDGQFLSVALRSDAAMSASAGVPVDAHAEADFADTLALLSIELHDANGEKIPDGVVSLLDENGDAIVTFPNTIETTTSTTQAGGTTTSTTQVGGTTTTSTTLPDPCAGVSSYEAITCRLAALAALVENRAGTAAPKLLAQIRKATAGVQKAAAAGTPRRVGKGLRRAVRALRRYDKLLASKKVRAALDDATRATLQAAGAAILSDVQTLL